MAAITKVTHPLAAFKLGKLLSPYVPAVRFKHYAEEKKLIIM